MPAAPHADRERRTTPRTPILTPEQRNPEPPTWATEAQLSQKHPQPSRCRVCGEDVNRTALVNLVYAYEPCECDFSHYTHLVAHPYHRACFLAHYPQPA